MRRRDAIVLCLALLLVACGPVLDRPLVTGAMVTTDPQVLVGEGVFFEYCHGCHPHGGRGLGRGVTDRPLPAFFVRLQVRNGFGQMPAFSTQEIDSQELDALLAYLSELRMVWTGAEE